MNENRNTVLYISHGAGPLPLLGDESHVEMVDNLQRLAARIGTPSAILVISAHWEEPAPSLTAAPRPELVYDYFGFPQEAYEIEYPAPGEPRLATKVHDTLAAMNIACLLDGQRGWTTACSCR